jgi:hypothetical protein
VSDDSRTTGEVRVYPPLKWNEIKHSDFLTENTRESGRKSGQSLVFNITVVTSETDEGEKTVKTCSSIVPVRNGHGASGYLAANMREIIEAHGDHVFEGEFITFPEPGMHVFPTRVQVSDDEVTEQTADVTWVIAKKV